MSCIQVGHIVIVVAMLGALTISLDVVSPAPIPQPPELEGGAIECKLDEQNILALIDKMMKHIRPTAKDIFKAFREYERIYKFQLNSTPDHSGDTNGKLSAEQRYECATRALERPGMALVRPIFWIFDSDIDFDKIGLSPGLEQSIEAKIDQVTAE